MKQVLTKSVESYFDNVHNQTIDRSNAVYLLERINEFEQMHLSHKDNFKAFRGLNFESILEIVQQSKHHLEQSHKLYIENGNLITINTKQYHIEQKNKEYSPRQNINIDDLSTAINNVLNPPNKKLKTISQTVSNMELKNLKKLNNKK